jgi:hypothetical protein
VIVLPSDGALDPASVMAVPPGERETSNRNPTIEDDAGADQSQ